jgi:hypothetical protein
MVRIKTAGLIFLLVVSSVLGVCGDVSAQQTRKTTDPAIVAIDAAIKSLKEQPNQFTLDVTVIGVSGTASGGGTGVSVVANGGGPGSQTTGLTATVDGTQVNIAQHTADTKLQQESQKAVKLLTDIKTALQAPKVDKPTVQAKLSEFLKTYVAPVLKSVIEALVMKRLGL